VIGREVARADVLAIAAIVREGQGAIVDQLEEAGRAAPVLYVRPTGFRHRCHVEAISVGDKGRFILGKLVEFPMPFKVLPKAIRAHRGLRGLDTRCDRYVEKTI
jgi:hypothetical protein